MSKTRDTWDHYDRIRGNCTGLLECCIEFFITTWPCLLRTRGPEYYKHHINIGYIPCPKCLVGKNFVKPLKCRPGCLCGWKDGTIMNSGKVYGDDL